MSELIIPDRLQAILTAGYDDIPTFAYYVLGMPLHPGQVKFLRRPDTKMGVLVPANRWGKSITVAVKHIHYCFYKKGIKRGSSGWRGLEYRTANIAPQGANTEAVFKAIEQILTSSFPIPQPDGSIRSNKCLIEWFYLPEKSLHSQPYKNVYANGSYTEHRSLGADKGDSLQGKPYGYISYDEGGRSDHLEEEWNENIMPRLFDWSGPFDLVSTPDKNSPSLLYHHELYLRGLDPEDQGVYTQEGSIDDNVFFGLEQIAKHKADNEHNPAKDQVLYGKFLFAGEAIYPADQIEDAMDESLNDSIRFIRGHKYVLAVDTSIGNDEFVILVLDYTTKPYQVVRLEAIKGALRSPQQHLQRLMDIYEAYNIENTCKIILETFNGESKRFYLDLPMSIQARTKCYGSWLPDGQKRLERGGKIFYKADIIMALQKILSAREVKVPANDQKLKGQLIQYREKDDNMKQDRIIALMLASWFITDGAPKFVKPIFVTSNW